MRPTVRSLVTAFVLLAIVLTVFTGCSGSAPAPTSAPAASTSSAPAAATKAPAAATTAPAAAQTSSAPAAASGKPFKIGLAFAQTGYLAGADRNVLNGALMAIDYINANGGVNGRKLEAYSEDMKSQPADGAAAVTKMLTQNDVKAVLMGFASSAAEAEAPIVADKNVPLLVNCLLPKDPKTTFGFLPAPTYQLDLAFQFLKSKNITEIGLLYNSSAYNKAVADMANGVAKKYGVTVVDAEEHATDATSLSVQITKIKDKNPKAIMSVASGSSSLLAAKELKAQGMTIPLLLVGGDEVTIQKNASATYENTFTAASGVQVYPNVDAAQKPMADIFVPLWTKKYPDQDPGNAATGWDMVYTLAQAIKAANGDDSKLVSVFETLSYTDGASMPFKFSADNHNGIRSNPWKIVQFPGGTLKIVFSPQ